MSKNIMHSRHDEYHKLTRGERDWLWHGRLCAKPCFRHNWGFLAFAYADGKYHQHGNGRLYFLFVRIINVFWDPMVGTYVDKLNLESREISPTGCYEPACR